MAARTRPTQHSFSAGEISPRMFGRTDYEKYQSGCAILENWLLFPQGGVTRRMGTKFVGAIKSHVDKPILLPFQFSDQQGYVLETGPSYFRFYKDSGQLFAEDIGIAITNGTFDTDLTGWTERNAGTGDVAQNGGVARFTANGAGNEARMYQSPTIAAPDINKVHILKFRVRVGTLRVRVGTAAGGEQVLAPRTFGRGYHTTTFVPTTAVPIFIEFENNTAAIADLDNVSLLDNAPLELESPYSQAVVPLLQYDQSADTMWLVARTQKPMTLLRFSDNDWSLVPYTPLGDPFTLLENGSFATSLVGWFERNAGTGDVTWDSTLKRAVLTSGVAGNEARLFQSIVVAAEPHIIRFSVFTGALTLRVGTTIGGGEVLGATSFGAGDHEILISPGAGTIHVEFEAPASTARGLDNVAVDAATGAGAAGRYPRAVSFWRSRIWFGGSDKEPQAVWSSHVDSFNNLDPGTALDDEGIKRVIAGGKVNVLQWMVPADKSMLLGTFGSEMVLHGDTNGVVTPAKATIDDGTFYGSAAIRPERADNFTIFVQRGRRKLRQFFFDFNTDKHHATDLTLIAEHITDPGVTTMSYQNDPEPALWCVRDDGQLLGLTFVYHEKIVGWHRQVTQGRFEWAAVIPHEDGDRDQVWALVRRLLPVPNVTGAVSNGLANLIRITTAAAHGLVTGEQVDIAGVLGVPAANGTWLVTVFDTTKFDLQGSVFTGTYTSGGTVKKVRRHVEFFDDVDGFYSRLNTDSALTAVFGSPVSSVGNLGHLEGLEVDIVGDGAVYPRKVVTAGSVPLDGPTALVVEVGLPYTSLLETLAPEIEGGSIQGLTVARGDATIRVLDTPVLTVNGDPLPDRSSEDDMDEALPLFSGDLVVPSLGWGPDGGKVVVMQERPLPATVTLIASNLAVGDE